MASNTIGGVSLGYIAQQTIETLVPELPKLKLFANDFSDETPNGASSITSRVVTQPTSGTDIAAAGGPAAAAQNTTITPVQITLGGLKGFAIGFTDEQWAKSVVNLHDLFIQPGLNSIAGGMIADALACVTIANFSSFQLLAAPAGSDVLALKGVLDAAYVPANERFILWDATRHNSILADTSIRTAYAFGNPELIQKGEIPSLFGFGPISEYVNMPSNNQHLAGIAAHKSAIALAARAPVVPEKFVGEIENVTEPESGLTIQVRRWYSQDLGQYFLGMFGMWGAAAANKSALVRITSAAQS